MNKSRAQFTFTNAGSDWNWLVAFPRYLADKMKEVIQILSASLAPITAIVAIVIAWRQHSLEKAKFRHLLYDKRYAIFNGTALFIAGIIQEGSVDYAALFKFQQDTNQA